MQYLIRVLVISLQIFDQFAIRPRKNNTPLEMLRMLLMMLMWLIISPLLIMFVPVKFLFYKLCNILSINGTRYHHGQIQVAQDHYLHPISGREIILIGMMHEAEKKFYQNIREITENYRRQGFAILTEGISKLTKAQSKKFSKKSRVLNWRMMSNISEKSQFAMLFDISSQELELKGLQSINNDFNVGKIVRAFKDNNLPIPHISTVDPKSFYKSLDDSILRMNDNKIIRIHIEKLLGDWTYAEIKMMFSGISRRYQKIIVQYRNQYAIKQVLKSAVAQDVLTMWGASHLKGMGLLLKKQGFKKVRRDWNTVFDTRSLTLNPEFKEYTNIYKAHKHFEIFGGYIMAASMTRNK